jgi:hypothetical protein
MKNDATGRHEFRVIIEGELHKELLDAIDSAIRAAVAEQLAGFNLQPGETSRQRAVSLGGSLAALIANWPNATSGVVYQPRAVNPGERQRGS